MGEKKITEFKCYLPDSSWEKLREIAAHRQVCTDETKRYSRVRNRLLEEAIESLYRREFPLEGDESAKSAASVSNENPMQNKEIMIFLAAILASQLRTKYLVASLSTNIFDNSVSILEAYKASKLAQLDWKELELSIKKTLDSGEEIDEFRDSLFSPTAQIEAAAKSIEAKINKTKTENTK